MILYFRFNLTDKEGSADRKVPIQPLAFTNKEGVITRYNLRKVFRKIVTFSNFNIVLSKWGVNRNSIAVWRDAISFGTITSLQGSIRTCFIQLWMATCEAVILSVASSFGGLWRCVDKHWWQRFQARAYARGRCSSAGRCYTCSLSKHAGCPTHWTSIYLFIRLRFIFQESVNSTSLLFVAFARNRWKFKYFDVAESLW